MNQLPSDSKSTIDLTGETVGEYYLIRRLGRGGMADVYLAEQKSLKRNVALKVLKPELARDDSYIQRFHREAQAAAGLVQANIVQIYEVNDADGYHFIAQEYVPGRNLRQYISRHGAVGPAMAINVLRQVSMALTKAGEMDVIHRDIKPENIMISTNGSVKVADFGLARVNNERARQDLTQIGITMGTPLYMSPEQVEGHNVDPRSDIYSLGVTAYHMLAGRPPYEGDNALAIALQHVNTEPESLEEIRPDVPKELCKLIHQMMSKSADNRPSSASALTRLIRKIKIDLDEDWETLIEKLAVTETQPNNHGTIVLPPSSLAVTKQLQAVMKGQIRTWWTQPSTWLLFGALLMLGFGLGSWYSLANPPNDPLNVEGKFLSRIKKEKDILTQYDMAMIGKTEEHWEAVREYFPVNGANAENNTIHWHRMSKARQGELHLMKEQWGQALELFNSLADISDVSERFNAIGWAGRAIVYHNQEELDVKEKIDLVDNALSQVESIERLDLLNGYLRTRVLELVKEYDRLKEISVSESH